MINDPLDVMRKKREAVSRAAAAAAATVAAGPTMTMDTGPKVTGVTSVPPSTENDSEANMIAAGKARADAAAAAQAKQAAANKPAPQPWDDPNYQEPAPPDASVYAGQGAATVVADQSRTGPAYGTTTQPTAPSEPTSKARDVFTIQRERVAADRVAEEKRALEAIRQRFTNQGLGDSGIEGAAERQERAALGHEAAARLSDIDMQESGQAYTADEAARARNAMISENEKDRILTTLEKDKDRFLTTSESALGRSFTTTERKAVQDYQDLVRNDLQVFTTSERISTQEWDHIEAALGRDFSTEERQAVQVWQDTVRKDVQTYNTSERIGTEAYNTSERVGSQDFQSALLKASGGDKDSLVKGLYLSERLGNLDPKSTTYQVDLWDALKSVYPNTDIGARPGGPGPNVPIPPPSPSLIRSDPTNMPDGTLADANSDVSGVGKVDLYWDGNGGRYYMQGNRRIKV